MRVFKKFCVASAGNMAITTAVAGSVLTLSVGAAIDGARMVGHANEIQNLADTAALAAMHPADMTFDQRERLALQTIESSLKQTPRKFELQKPTVYTDKSSQTVEVDLTAKVPMLFGSLLGEDGRVVRGNAVAGEYDGGQNGGYLGKVALSFVLDASLSMDEPLKRSRRLDAIRAAVSDVFGGATSNDPNMPIEAAIYPFEWGMTDERMDTMRPGTQGLIDALAYLTTSEGSVPAESLEKAVDEQINEAREGDNVRRVVIYITDGGVDAEKSDKQGKMVKDGEFFPNGAACAVPIQLGQALDDLAYEIEKVMDVDGATPIMPDGSAFTDKNQLRYEDAESDAENYARMQDALAVASEVLIDRLDMTGSFPDSGGGALNLGLTPDAAVSNVQALELGGGAINWNGLGQHYGNLRADRKALDDLMETWKDTCRPMQEVRVIEACDRAQDKGIEIMAIDLSGEEASAEEITTTCVFDDPDTPENESDNMPQPTVLGGTGSETSMTYEDADGSVYAVINDEASLRKLLRTLLPEKLTMTSAKADREVRLIR